MKYVLSDIHGNMEAWESIKSQIMLGKKDDLYILGDVIDRGLFGIEILEEIMRKPNMHMLLGNHEYMMLNALNVPYVIGDPSYTDYTQLERMSLWFHNGGEPTYRDWQDLNAIERGNLLDFLKGLPLNMEVEANKKTFVMVHANSAELIASILRKNFVKDEQQSAKIAYFAVWDRDHLALSNTYYERRNKIMIFGHTPTIHFDSSLNEWRNDEPFLNVYKWKRGHLIGIDCGAGLGDARANGKQGRLSCICLDTMKVFYSR